MKHIEQDETDWLVYGVEADWYRSPEYLEAVQRYASEMSQQGEYLTIFGFKQSEEFRNARLAYRRRVNGSPSAETT